MAHESAELFFSALRPRYTIFPILYISPETFVTAAAVSVLTPPSADPFLIDVFGICLQGTI